MKDQQEALENRAVAGGATMENQLAARQSANETMSGVYTNLLMGEDARKQAINQQKLRLNQDYSAGVQSSFLQNAQNWQAWGAQMAQAGMQLGSSALLGGIGGGASAGHLPRSYGALTSPPVNTDFSPTSIPKPAPILGTDVLPRTR